jgi:pimeloyl-ACP methyl ester carboxylesterase
VRALLRYSPFVPDLIRRQAPDNAFIHPRQKKAIENHPGKIEALRRLLTMVFPVTPRLAGMLNDLYWMVQHPIYPLEKIDTPTLVVHGERDIVVPLEQAHYTISRIPGAKLVTVPGGGHFAFAVFGDEIKDIILRFLRENL